jgi:hypothetical protein
MQWLALLEQGHRAGVTVDGDQSAAGDPLCRHVIDLDSEAAVDALEEALAGKQQLRGPVVATGHGFHWYVKPTGLRNRAGVLPGVDFRGRGGYVVGPPSRQWRG